MRIPLIAAALFVGASACTGIVTSERGPDVDAAGGGGRDGGTASGDGGTAPGDAGDFGCGEALEGRTCFGGSCTFRGDGPCAVGSCTCVDRAWSCTVTMMCTEPCPGTEPRCGETCSTDAMGCSCRCRGARNTDACDCTGGVWSCAGMCGA